MLILGLLGMYFDAAVVFVTFQTLLLRLAAAILCRNLRVLTLNCHNSTLIHTKHDFQIIYFE